MYVRMCVLVGESSLYRCVSTFCKQTSRQRKSSKSPFQRKSIMTESRKRVRSEEDDFGMQKKYFVNQQLLEKNSDQLMKIVYGKIGANFILQVSFVFHLFIHFRENSQLDICRRKASESEYRKQN